MVLSDGVGTGKRIFSQVKSNPFSSLFLLDTHLLSGSMYWRYDEVVGHVELDYPRDISMWEGIPNDIDSVFKNYDGKTYFFKGRKYFEFDDLRMKVRPNSGKDTYDETINVRWLQCPPKELIQDPFRHGSTILSQARGQNHPVFLVISLCLSVICSYQIQNS